MTFTLSPSLDSTILKLARAEYHIADLAHQEAAFLAAGPRRLQGERQPGRYQVRYQVVAEPLVSWGAVIGDAVHNLRSALDHLVYELTALHSGAPVTDTSFPVFASEAAYDASGRSGAGSRIRGIHPDAQKIVRALQPFNMAKGPTRDALWLLNRLWNIDKHRHVHLAVVHPAAVGVSASTQMGDAPQSFTDEFAAPPYDDGQVIWTTELPPGADVPTDPLIQCQVVFGDARAPEIKGPVVETLRVIHGYLERYVVPQFLPFCAAPSSAGTR